MPEHDPLVLSFSHLRDFPREKEALQTLKKVASLVKPIMRARQWIVRELAEFFPDQANLLGLNVNRGQKILIRLRYPGDRNQFLPIEQVTDTLLHELSHIVHGPHDAKFHALWNQLRDEHEGLVRKGYTGEGFLSDGHRLGGRPIPLHEARRLARAAAEKRRVLSAGSGQKLGGYAPRPSDDIRRVIADAAERRKTALQGCGNENHNEEEIRKISETATKNGFKTQAEEDAANEAAIAQALWELVQEDEKAKYGTSYIPPSVRNPEGNGGGVYVPAEEDIGRTAKTSETSSRAEPESTTRSDNTPAVQKPSSGWTCPMCTLHNPATYLCCDACGSERKDAAEPLRPTERSTKRRRPITNTSDKTKSEGNSGPRNAGQATEAPPEKAFWQCSFCGNFMEREWWTCSVCGKMKENSK